MTLAYYNENDPYCAQWLRNLVSDNLIAPGYVDERDIRDVRPVDLEPYAQFHFFAGIGGWSAALRLADIPDNFPVWTGSCPCQPFSAAGKAGGFADERHLWPDWFHLLRVCRPAIVLGEQVASKAGLAWYDLVRADLENEGYAVGAADLCAAGVGAPHIRRRLWFVAMDDAVRNGRQAVGRHHGAQCAPAERSGEVVTLADALHGLPGERREFQGASGAHEGEASEQGRNGVSASHRGADSSMRYGAGGELAHAVGNRRQNGRIIQQQLETQSAGIFGDASQRSRRTSWTDCDWLPCADGKARPVEPGTFPLVDGVSFKLGSGGAFEGKSRQGMLRGYGNAIVPQVAAEFIRAALG